MSENNFSETVESLFKGMDNFITTKTVVGDALKVNEEVTILPLVDVSFGVGAGAFADDDKKKNTGAGGLGGKITPNCVLVLNNGEAKIVSCNDTDASPVSKIMDKLPDVFNKIKGKKKEDEETSEEE